MISAYQATMVMDSGTGITKVTDIHTGKITMVNILITGTDMLIKSKATMIPKIFNMP